MKNKKTKNEGLPFVVDNSNGYTKIDEVDEWLPFVSSLRLRIDFVQNNTG